MPTPRVLRLLRLSTLALMLGFGPAFAAPAARPQSTGPGRTGRGAE